MRWILVLLLLAGCSHFTAEERAEIERQNNEAIERAVTYLNRTPHEVCQKQETRDRFGSLAECKEAVARDQERVREGLARIQQQAFAREQMAGQMMMNYWQSRRSAPPAFVPIQPYQMQVPQQQRTNCSTYMVGGTAQTDCSSW